MKFKLNFNNFLEKLFKKWIAIVDWSCKENFEQITLNLWKYKEKNVKYIKINMNCERLFLTAIIFFTDKKNWLNATV